MSSTTGRQTRTGLTSEMAVLRGRIDFASPRLFTQCVFQTENYKANSGVAPPRESLGYIYVGPGTDFFLFILKKTHADSNGWMDSVQ